MDIPLGDEGAVAQAFGITPMATVAASTQLQQVDAPTLMQTTGAVGSLGSLGGGIGVGGGKGVGNMNFGMLGSAVTDFFQGAGAEDEAKEYGVAATLASQEAEFTKESTAVQNEQASREVMMTVGGQKAQVSSRGFTGGGSNMQLLRSSAQQAALGHQMITMQGGINEAAYKEQAQAYTFMKEAENTAANGDFAGGILNAIGGIFNL